MRFSGQVLGTPEWVLVQEDERHGGAVSYLVPTRQGSAGSRGRAACCVAAALLSAACALTDTLAL